MKICYKINGHFVSKIMLKKSLSNTSELIIWDKVISNLFNEIKDMEANIIFNYEGGAIRLISDTKILYKLFAENLKIRDAILLAQNATNADKPSYGRALAAK